MCAPGWAWPKNVWVSCVSVLPAAKGDPCTLIGSMSKNHVTFIDSVWSGEADGHLPSGRYWAMMVTVCPAPFSAAAACS